MSALLFGIWLSFRVAGGERIFSRMLVDGLNSMEDQPWGTMRSGKGITVEWLANQLERHGIRPRTIRIGEKQAKGYYGEDFKEAFQRYMSPSDMQKLARNESALASTDPRLHDVSARQAGATSPPSSLESGATGDGGKGPEIGEQKSDPPLSDSGATRASEQKKDEPGEAQGGEAAAA